MTEKEAIKRWGPIVNGVWQDAAKHAVLIEIPLYLGMGWRNTATGTIPTRHIYCNKDLEKPLLLALNNLRNRGFLAELATFDGCYSVRDVRGCQGRHSFHSWAAAIDINAASNPLGGPSSLSPGFVQCFTDTGLKWGGSFFRMDPMHFSLGG